MIETLRLLFSIRHQGPKLTTMCALLYSFKKTFSLSKKYFAKARKLTLKKVIRILNKKWVLKLFDFKTQAQILHPSLFETLVWIDPKQVQLATHNDYRSNMAKHRFVEGGCWDTEGSDLIEKVRVGTHKTLVELFEKNIDYKQTTQYASMNIKIKQKGKSYWCRTTEDLDKYFETLRCARNAIATGGYKTQEQLFKETPDKIRPDKVFTLNDEIKVFISRNGEFVLGGGGGHRILIAKSVNTPSIPVIVTKVHLEWAKKCYYTHNKKSLFDCINKEIRNMSKVLE